MRPHLPHGTHEALVRFFAERRRRRAAEGRVVVGHHNRNLILPLGQPLAYLLGIESGRVRAKFRMPVETVQVVPRIWRESDVLRVVSDRLDDVPRCLADFGEWSLHTYVAGRSLDETQARGAIGEERMSVLADFFAQLADVPPGALPQPPEHWPHSGDSQGFLRRLVRFTEKRVHEENLPRFGRLFASVGVAGDIVGGFLRSAQPLTTRPFILLHTDVHRANVITTATPQGERLSVLDWELSLYGDALHDLATHLVRMGYDETEQKTMTALWADAMRGAGHPELTAGMDRDLRTYLDFEYVQSVFPDVMRAALALPEEPGAEDFARAADQVRRALHRAWARLWPERAVVDERAAVKALRRWHAEDSARRLAAAEAAARQSGRRSGWGEWCATPDRAEGLSGTTRARRGPDPRPASRRRPDRAMRSAETAETLRGLEPHGS